MQEYVVALTSATRRTEELMLGASPRATLHLVRAAKAFAAIQGREYVLPDDIARWPGRPAHRLLPSVEAAMSGRSTATILEGILAGVPVPAAPDSIVREALAGLTVRGRAFLAAGATAIVCAVLLGQPALTRVGVLVVVLPLVTAW